MPYEEQLCENKENSQNNNNFGNSLSINTMGFSKGIKAFVSRSATNAIDSVDTTAAADKWSNFTSIMKEFLPISLGYLKKDKILTNNETLINGKDKDNEINFLPQSQNEDIILENVKNVSKSLSSIFNDFDNILNNFQMFTSSGRFSIHKVLRHPIKFKKQLKNVLITLCDTLDAFVQSHKTIKIDYKLMSNNKHKGLISSLLFDLYSKKSYINDIKDAFFNQVKYFSDNIRSITNKSSTCITLAWRLGSFITKWVRNQKSGILEACDLSEDVVNKYFSVGKDSKVSLNNKSDNQNSFKKVIDTIRVVALSADKKGFIPRLVNILINVIPSKKDPQKVANRLEKLSKNHKISNNKIDVENSYDENKSIIGKLRDVIDSSSAQIVPIKSKVIYYRNIIKNKQPLQLFSFLDIGFKELFSLSDFINELSVSFKGGKVKEESVFFKGSFKDTYNIMYSFKEIFYNFMYKVQKYNFLYKGYVNADNGMVKDNKQLFDFLGDLVKSNEFGKLLKFVDSKFLKDKKVSLVEGSVNIPFNEIMSIIRLLPQIANRILVKFDNYYKETKDIIQDVGNNKFIKKLTSLINKSKEDKTDVKDSNENISEVKANSTKLKIDVNDIKLKLFMLSKLEYDSNNYETSIRNIYNIASKLSSKNKKSMLFGQDPRLFALISMCLSFYNFMSKELNIDEKSRKDFGSIIKGMIDYIFDNNGNLQKDKLSFMDEIKKIISAPIEDPIDKGKINESFNEMLKSDKLWKQSSVNDFIVAIQKNSRKVWCDKFEGLSDVSDREVNEMLNKNLEDIMLSKIKELIVDSARETASCKKLIFSKSENINEEIRNLLENNIQKKIEKIGIFKELDIIDLLNKNNIINKLTSYVELHIISPKRTNYTSFNELSSNLSPEIKEKINAIFKRDNKNIEKVSKIYLSIIKNHANSIDNIDNIKQILNSTIEEARYSKRKHKRESIKSKLSGDERLNEMLIEQIKNINIYKKDIFNELPDSLNNKISKMVEDGLHDSINNVYKSLMDGIIQKANKDGRIDLFNKGIIVLLRNKKVPQILKILAQKYNEYDLQRELLPSIIEFISSILNTISNNTSLVKNIDAEIFSLLHLTNKMDIIDLMEQLGFVSLKDIQQIRSLGLDLNVDKLLHLILKPSGEETIIKLGLTLVNNILNMLNKEFLDELFTIIKDCNDNDDMMKKVKKIIRSKGIKTARGTMGLNRKRDIAKLAVSAVATVIPTSNAPLRNGIQEWRQHEEQEFKKGLNLPSSISKDNGDKKKISKGNRNRIRSVVSTMVHTGASSSIGAGYQEHMLQLGQLLENNNSNKSPRAVIGKK